MTNLYSSIHQPVIFFFNQSYRSFFLFISVLELLLFFPSYQIENGHSKILSFTEMLLEPLLSIPQFHFSPGFAYNGFEFHFAFKLEVIMTRLEGESLSTN